MDKSCRQCSLNFEVYPEDLAFYKKVSVPAPTLCPECRLKRRLRWRNDKNLFKRKCDFGGKELISMYPPDSPHKVYDKEIWWSDKWDPLEYGRDFDFSRPFFEQWQELHLGVPYPHIATEKTENALYTNYNVGNRNCYLCFAGNYLEDSYYCYLAQESKDMIDCSYVYKSELCYGCVQCTSCYNVNFSVHAKSCSDSWFLDDCINCHNCFMCFNLRNKQYCILNKQYTKEEYFEKLNQFDLKSNEGIEKAYSYWLEQRYRFPKKANQNRQVEDCTGEYIFESKNVRDSYVMAPGGEDLRYIFNGFPRLKDAYDCSFVGEDAELMYECVAAGDNCSNMMFCSLCFTGCYNLTYCSFVVNSKDCFGCVGLRNKQYCILNKQHSEEDYKALVPRIIEHIKSTGEWGEFFPAELSPFKHEDSWAKEVFG